MVGIKAVFVSRRLGVLNVVESVQITSHSYFIGQLINLTITSIGYQIRWRRQLLTARMKFRIIEPKIPIRYNSTFFPINQPFVKRNLLYSLVVYNSMKTYIFTESKLYSKF